MEVFFVVWMIALTIAAGICERAEKKAKRNPPAAGGRTGGRAKAHSKTTLIVYTKTGGMSSEKVHDRGFRYI